uniref:diacylglycerol kinase family protein n=1 Tax=Dialister micraerophilus TaxID=309120 RepID=UPI0023EF8E6F
MNKLEKNCTVIVNPTSGRGRSTRYLPMLSDVLKEKYENITIKTTKKTKDATRFARIAAKNNEDIICMCRDGTINETINGIVP